MARIVREMRPCCPQKVAICSYRFYFQKGSRPAVGNDYLDAALSTNSFLGYEALEDTISLDGE